MIINREEDQKVEGMIKQDTIPSNNHFSVEVLNDGSLGNLKCQSITCETHLFSVPSMGTPIALVFWAHRQQKHVKVKVISCQNLSLTRYMSVPSNP